LKDNAPEVHYEVNDHEYNKVYYIVDGIYPPWFTFVRTIRISEEEKYRMFVKDKMLVGRMWSGYFVWARPWISKMIMEVMTACVIMYNMIVEEKRDGNLFVTR
jgi:hypothetical protein